MGLTVHIPPALLIDIPNPGNTPREDCKVCIIMDLVVQKYKLKLGTLLLEKKLKLYVTY